MNQQQKAYAMARVSSILNKKGSELKARFTTKGKSLTFVEKCRLIRNGGAELLPDSQLSTWTDLKDAFLWGQHEIQDHFDQSAYDSAIEPFQAEATRIQDQLMLGDAEEALKLIQAFESKAE